jgi:hypothetical protein
MKMLQGMNSRDTTQIRRNKSAAQCIYQQLIIIMQNQNKSAQVKLRNNNAESK